MILPDRLSRPSLSRPAAARGRGATAGFSLLELMMVLLLLGLIAGISTPAIGRFLDNLEFRRQVGDISAVLRYARLSAVAKGEKVRVSIPPEENQALRLAGGVEEVRPGLFTEEGQLVMDPAEIVFYPEGRATPGILTFSMGNRRQSIIMDPLTALPLLD